MDTVADLSAFESRVRRVQATRMAWVAVIGSPTRTTDMLVGAWLAAGINASVLTPALALTTLQAGVRASRRERPEAALCRRRCGPGGSGWN